MYTRREQQPHSGPSDMLCTGAGANLTTACQRPDARCQLATLNEASQTGGTAGPPVKTGLRRTDTKDSFDEFKINMIAQGVCLSKQLNGQRPQQQYALSMPPTGPIAQDKSPESKSKRPEEPFPYAGFLGTVFASFLASMGVFCLKLLPVDNTIQEKAKACMIRGIFMTMFCAFNIVQQRQSFKIPRGEYLLNISRAILGAMNTFLVFVAVQFITMGECSALKYSSPVWTCMLGFLVLKESIPVCMFLAIPLSLVGIVLLAHPGLVIEDALAAGTLLDGTDSVLQNSSSTTSGVVLDVRSDGGGGATLLATNVTRSNVAESIGLDSDTIGDGASYFDRRWPGIVAALGSSLCIAASIIILKFRKKTPIVTVSFYMGLATGVVAFFIQLAIGFGAMPTTMLEWFLHVCIGFFAYSVQCVLQWSLQFVPAGSYSVIRSLDIVIGFLLGAAFLNDTPLWTSIVGSVLIMIVVSMLILNDHLERALKFLCRCCGCSQAAANANTQNDDDCKK
jgi:drug/metabolite transporter (DMT)-like permease